jgi:hypothetical protein
MTNAVKATPQFKRDFETVSAHYMLAELGELDQAKQSSRGDMENAERSFSAMASDIRNNGLRDVTDTNIGDTTQRIRNDIERMKTK